MTASAFRRVGPPALAFAAVRVLFLLIGAWSVPRAPGPERWLRWDSWHYLAVADHGYEIHPCAPGEGVPGAAWCGDAGWFPGYPLMIRAAASAGVPPRSAAAALPGLAAFLTLLLVWNFFLIGRAGAWSAVFLAAFFPGAIYQHAAFPMSLCVCAVLAAALAVRRENPLAAAAAAAFAATVYPVAAALVPAALAAAFLAPAGSRRRRACAASAAGALLGLAAVAHLQRRDLGVWDGWARVQEMSLYRSGDPFRWRRMLYIPIVFRPTALTRALVIAQSLLVAALVLGAAAAARAAGVAALSGEDAWLWSATVVLWLAPHLSGYRQCYYRSESLLLPLAVWAPRWPRAWRWAALAASVILAALMAREFFEGRLV